MEEQQPYELKINIQQDLFPYESCETQDVYLKKHQELPNGYKYEEALLSSDEKYIGILGRGSSQDIVLIWKMDNLEEYKYKYEGKIECFDFAANSKSFVIVYRKSPPVNYNIASGKPIKEFESVGGNTYNVLSYSFSPKSRYFGLATSDRFTVWDIISGKVVKNIVDNSPSKYIRKNLIVYISDSCEIRVVQFKDEKEIAKFKLEKISSDKDILNCMLSPDLQYFFYATKEGIYKSDINSGKIQLVQEFPKEDTTMVIISSDCEDAVSTNMVDIFYWKLGGDKLGTILKEKFTSMSCNFEKNKIVIVDDICVNIFDYSTEDQDEKFIWLNENPTSFETFVFCPTFTVLLAIIDEHNAILYDTQTGKAIKKWRNELPKWSQTCQMAPETSQAAIVATKSTDDKVKIWNYNNGSEIMTLTGFNANMFSFSPKGNLLAAGGKKGYEIARVWDLTTGNFNSLNYEDHPNLNTTIHLTKNEPYKVIAVAENQKPVVFDVESGKLLYECSKCPVDFKSVDDIKSAQKQLFFVKGLTTENENVAVLFNMNDGEVIKVYKNCVNIDISSDEKFILSKSDNENNGSLTIGTLDDITNIRTAVAELNPDLSSFLQGNQTIVSPFGTRDHAEFILTLPSSGKCIGKLDFIKKTKVYSEVDLSVNEESNLLVFRYIQLE